MKKTKEVIAVIIKSRNVDGIITPFDNKHSSKNPYADRRKLIGLTKNMACGMRGTVVGYKNANNIVVELEDGGMVNSTYEAFVKGII